MSSTGSPLAGALHSKGQASRMYSLKKSLVSMSQMTIKDLAKKKKNHFSGSKLFRNYVKSVFKEYDRDGNARIEKHEIYEMVLKLYLQVATMTTVSSSTVPSRERVIMLFDLCDKDKSGYLDLPEFEAMCIVLCEGMAARLSMAFLNKLVLAPILGYLLCEFMIMCWEFSGMSIMFAPVLWMVPSWIYSEASLLTVGTGVVNAFIFPYIMGLMDRYLALYYKASNMASLEDEEKRKSAKIDNKIKET